MSCHLYRNVRLGLYRDDTLNTEALQRALEGSLSDQRHQMGLAFSPRRSRHSRENVGVDGLDMAESGNSKERITEKAEG